MKIFMSLRDVGQLNPASPHRRLVNQLLRRWITAHARCGNAYNPDEHGYLVLIEPIDLESDHILPELPCSLCEVPWEGVSRIGDYYYAVTITNNDFVIGCLIPDAPWLYLELRQSLEDHAV
ncbi:MAG: hypothetical protein RJS98_09610 [Rhodospirillaceae bacterium]